MTDKDNGGEIDWPAGDEEEERERLAGRDEDELRDELQRIDNENEEWQAQYGVDSPEQLRSSIDDELPVEEREQRREDAYDWEHNLHHRDLIVDVLNEEESQ